MLEFLRGVQKGLKTANTDAFKVVYHFFLKTSTSQAEHHSYTRYRRPFPEASIVQMHPIMLQMQEIFISLLAT